MMAWRDDQMVLCMYKDLGTIMNRGGWYVRPSGGNRRLADHLSFKGPYSQGVLDAQRSIIGRRSLSVAGDYQVASRTSRHGESVRASVDNQAHSYTASWRTLVDYLDRRTSLQTITRNTRPRRRDLLCGHQLNHTASGRQRPSRIRSPVSYDRRQEGTDTLPAVHSSAIYDLDRDPPVQGRFCLHLL